MRHQALDRSQPILPLECLSRGGAMPEISNEGVSISYEVAGQGRPLILLHGWSGDRSLWTVAGYVEDLSRDHLLIAVDLRGHGASDKPHEPAAYRTGAVTSDVLAVADAEGLDRFAIWGQSYGGDIAWRTADAVPERVAAIVTTGAWDPWPHTEEDWWLWFDERTRTRCSPSSRRNFARKGSPTSNASPFPHCSSPGNSRTKTMKRRR
jgi:pimeloyl-ACP methyl ester carboxylesterase